MNGEGQLSNVVKKLKRQYTEQEKLFANYVSDKGLIARLYKDILQLNKKTAQV